MPHRFDGDGQLLDRRGDDDGDVRVVLLDDLQDVDGADAGQRDVEEDDVHALALRHVDGAFAGGRAQHAVVAAQRAAQGRRGSPRRCPRRAPFCGARPCGRV
jgi:hypothetical protein